MIFCAEEPQKNEERRKGRTRENASRRTKYLDIPFRGTGFIRRRRTERDVAKADVGLNTPWSIGSHSTLNRLMLHVESADTPRYVGRHSTLCWPTKHVKFFRSSYWFWNYLCINGLQSTQKSLFSSVAERRLLTEFFLVHSKKKTRRKFRAKQRGWQKGEKRVGKNLYKTRLLRSFLLSVPFSRFVPEVDTYRRKDRHFYPQILAHC